MDITYKFSKPDFSEFLARMQAFGTVHAPVRVSDQSFAFKPINAASEIAFEALRTILPPKKFFYPQRETVLRYNGDNFEEVEPPPEKIVIFGAHPCDLAGLGIMDQILTAAPADNHYISRRDNALIVGLSCMPDKHCFCKSMGTDSLRGGYDIFLTDIGDSYFVQVATNAGRLLLADADFIVAVSDSDKAAYNKFWLDREKAFENGFDGTNLRSTLDLEWNNQVWEDLGNRCLSCGNCVPVCPTCYCFDIVDVAQLDGNSGERVREWDACQFVGFAKVAGDYNFRPGPVDRLKFWYRHKLHGFDDAYGLPTCVGCGRCTVSCPSGIDDIVGTVLHLQGEKVSLNVGNLFTDGKTDE